MTYNQFLAEYKIKKDEMDAIEDSYTDFTGDKTFYIAQAYTGYAVLVHPFEIFAKLYVLKILPLQREVRMLRHYMMDDTEVMVDEALARGDYV